MAENASRLTLAAVQAAKALYMPTMFRGMISFMKLSYPVDNRRLYLKNQQQEAESNSTTVSALSGSSGEPVGPHFPEWNTSTCRYQRSSSYLGSSTVVEWHQWHAVEVTVALLEVHDSATMVGTRVRAVLGLRSSR